MSLPFTPPPLPSQPSAFEPAIAFLALFRPLACFFPLLCAVKAALLACLTEEPVPHIRRKLTHTVGLLAGVSASEAEVRGGIGAFSWVDDAPRFFLFRVFFDC